MIFEIGPLAYSLAQQALLTAVILTVCRAFVFLFLNDVQLADIPLIWRKERRRKDRHLAE